MLNHAVSIKLLLTFIEFTEKNKNSLLKYEIEFSATLFTMFDRICSLIFWYQYIAMETHYTSHVFQYGVHVFRRLVVEKM